MQMVLWYEVTSEIFFFTNHWKIFSGMPASPTTITLPSLKKRQIEKYNGSKIIETKFNPKSQPPT